MEGVLSQAGYEVTCLESGREVVEAARRTRPDLIFVDFAMPELNGYGVCKLLGEHQDVEVIPIVIMSTRGDSVGERFIRDMDIVDHISKPFAPEALLAVVQHILDKTRGTDKTLRRRAPTSTPKKEPSVDPEVRARKELAALLAQAIAEAGKTQHAQHLEGVLVEPAVVALLREINAGDALSGNLSAVSLAEVMQLLSLQRQTGFLGVRHAAAEVTIAFQRGKVRLVKGANLPAEFLLGSILVRQKLMAPEELDLFLSNRQGTSRRIGTQAVRLGYLRREELQAALRMQSSELVYEMLRWSSGRFRFEPIEALPADVLEFEFDLSIDELLMEGFRRVDEWGLIESVIPDFQSIPTLVPGGVERVGRDALTEEERAVLDAINGKRSVQEIVNCVRLATFDVARLLYRLVSTHVVQV